MPNFEEVVKVATAEKVHWENPIVQVTPFVSFQPRVIVERSRKNYLGVFDNPYDETGRELLWHPLTEDTVESIVKNVDLDTKDINLRARTAQGRNVANFFRLLLRNKLDELDFGRFLNKLIRKLCIDGTAIAKVVVVDGKVTLSSPDILNIYVDPSVDSLHDSSAILERHWMRIDEFMRLDVNKKEDASQIFKNKRIPRTETGENTEVPYIDVWERYGLLDKSFVTDNKEDEGQYVETRAIITGLEEGEAIVHKVELNKDGVRPYEEVQYKEVQGRWHGRGVAEMLFQLQEYINEIVNIRLSTNRFKQTGLFKVRKGAGINRQDIAQLSAGGVVQVSRIDDIVELRQSDQQPSSYRDEDVTRDTANRLVGSFPVSTGESLPASQPATTAVISQQGAQSGFAFTQENIGLFVRRLLERHIIPKIVQTLKEGEMVDITGNPKELHKLDEIVADHKLAKDIKQFRKKNGRYPSAQEVAEERQRIIDNLKQNGDTRYFKIKKDALNTKFAVEVYITDEKINKQVMVRDLIDTISQFGNLPGIGIDSTEVVKEILDLMDLDSNRFLMTDEQIAQQQQQAAQQQAAAQGGGQSQTELTASALTQEAQGRM